MATAQLLPLPEEFQEQEELLFLGYLPEEIITEILLWLPVKPIVRFKCVCKSWMALLTDPEFAKQHQLRAITLRKHKECLLMSHLSIPKPKSESENNIKKKGTKLSCSSESRMEETYSLLYKGSAKESARVELPAAGNIVKSCRHTIIDSSNGIVCLADSKSPLPLLTSNEEDEEIVIVSPLLEVLLWNPSTSEVKALPTYFPNRLQGYVNVSAYGFAFHPTLKDYQVVRIVNFHHVNFQHFYKVEMYSLRAQCWETIANPNDYNILCRLHDSVSRAFVNEALHWVAYKEGNNTDPDQYFVLAFNTRKKKLAEIPMPADINYSEDEFLLHESSSSSSLSLTVCRKYEGFEVWVLEKYATGAAALWSKRRWVEFGPTMEIMKPVHVLDDGKMIMEMHVNEELVFSFWGEEELVLCNSEFQIIKSLPFMKPAKSDFASSLEPGAKALKISYVCHP